MEAEMEVVAGLVGVEGHVSGEQAAIRSNGTYVLCAHARVNVARWAAVAFHSTRSCMPGRFRPGGGCRRAGAHTVVAVEIAEIKKPKPFCFSAVYSGSCVCVWGGGGGGSNSGEI